MSQRRWPSGLRTGDGVGRKGAFEVEGTARGQRAGEDKVERSAVWVRQLSTGFGCGHGEAGVTFSESFQEGRRCSRKQLWAWGRPSSSWQVSPSNSPTAPPSTSYNLISSAKLVDPGNWRPTALGRLTPASLISAPCPGCYVCPVSPRVQGLRVLALPHDINNWPWKEKGLPRNRD